MTKELEFLIKIVKEANKLITDDFIVKSKGDHGDLVTNFDLEIEKFIIDEIKKEYPDFDIVSEEFNSNKELTDNCFTIDPIDGTINFAHNLPLWAIQIACIKNKETCAAVIYMPKINEFYYADKNGAFLNDKQIFVNKLSVDKGLYTFEGPGSMLCNFNMLKKNHNYRDFRSAAVNFAFVASGKLSATCFLWDTYWDYIPGEYIVKQAGGVIYNDKKIHIAANSEEFLKTMLDNTIIDDNKELVIKDKE